MANRKTERHFQLILRICGFKSVVIIFSTFVSYPYSMKSTNQFQKQSGSTLKLLTALQCPYQHEPDFKTFLPHLEGHNFKKGQISSLSSARSFFHWGLPIQQLINFNLLLLYFACNSCWEDSSSFLFSVLRDGFSRWMTVIKRHCKVAQKKIIPERKWERQKGCMVTRGGKKLPLQRHETKDLPQVWAQTGDKDEIFPY